MPAQRKLSPRQMELLLEFIEKRPHMALGRFQGPQASQAARQAWHSLANILNCNPEGTTKTPEQWRRYWIEFKARTKTKAADSRRRACKTGDSSNNFAPLTSIEERVLALLGKVAVEGLPEVRIPINIPTVEHTEPDKAYSSDFLHQANPPEVMELQVEVDVPDDNTSPLPLISSPSSPIAQREDRHSRISPNLSRRPRPRIRRTIRRDRNVPRWVYELEMSRIAAENKKISILTEKLKIQREKLLEIKETRKIHLEKLTELKEIKLALQELNHIMKK